MLWRGEASWILEIDVESYFDSIDRKMLQELIQERVRDGSLKRLIGKCLHVGVLDGEEYSEPGEGTVQGSVLSPVLGNIYLHHVLDVWFEREVTPRLRGKARLIRYADDAVIAFEREDDAYKVLEVMHKRFARYGCGSIPRRLASSPSSVRLRCRAPRRDQRVSTSSVSRCFGIDPEEERGSHD